MGYYTRYEVNQMEEEISEFVGYNPFDDSCKWYDYDKYMKAFSLLHPNELFELEGVGEEFPDIWKAFYKNGKGYRNIIEIKYPEYDGSLER